MKSYPKAQRFQHAWLVLLLGTTVSVVVSGIPTFESDVLQLRLRYRGPGMRGAGERLARWMRKSGRSPYRRCLLASVALPSGPSFVRSASKHGTGTDRRSLRLADKRSASEGQLRGSTFAMWPNMAEPLSLRKNSRGRRNGSHSLNWSCQAVCASVLHADLVQRLKSVPRGNQADEEPRSPHVTLT